MKKLNLYYKLGRNLKYLQMIFIFECQANAIVIVKQII